MVIYNYNIADYINEDVVDQWSKNVDQMMASGDSQFLLVASNDVMAMTSQNDS